MDFRITRRDTGSSMVGGTLVVADIRSSDGALSDASKSYAVFSSAFSVNAPLRSARPDDVAALVPGTRA